MFFNAVQIVASIFLLIGLGVLMTHLGWLDKPGADLISKLVTQIGLPAMTIAQLFTQYDRPSLLAALPYLGMAFLAIALSYCLSYAVQALFHVPAEKRGVFRCLFTFGNTIFIGLPISTALFGEVALPASLMYYLANTTLFWTLGVDGVQKDAAQKNAGTIRTGFSWAALKRILTVPLITFAACTVGILLGLRLPKLLLDTARYAGGIVTPLSLFFIGSVLQGMFKRGLTWQPGYTALLLSRFLLSPLIILGIGALLGGLPGLWRSAFIMQASMPSQSSSAIVAHSYGGDAEYATGGITLTTLCSLITIPLYAAVTGWLS